VKDIRLDTTRAKYWLGVGAQPSDPVWRLLSMFGLIEPQWQVQRLLATGGEKMTRNRKPKLQQNLNDVVAKTVEPKAATK